MAEHFKELENFQELENFEELFEQSLKQVEMRTGKIISAEIISVDKDKGYAMVDAGLKSESFIPIPSLKVSDPDLELIPGNRINVVLGCLDNGRGESKLSREEAKKVECWDKIIKAFENNETIIGRINHPVRGGYNIDLDGGLKAFLPGSLVDAKPVKDASHLENQDIELKVIKTDIVKHNIVVSRKAVLIENNSGNIALELEKFSEGDAVKGVVKNITKFGAFIDLNGVDALLHITDISWNRISHPSDVLSVDQEIEIKITKIDKEKQRISVGLKQLSKDPWLNIVEELPIGTKLIGTVASITDYGCFVKLKDGVEGLVYKTEINWTNKNPNPHKSVTIDQEVEVIILEIIASKHRISLSIKQCKPNPWSEFEQNYQPGDKIKGTIRSITEFGVFVGLGGDIDGLVHISDVAWNNPDKAIKNLNKGDELEVMLILADIKNERISLSIKKLSEDPFKKFINAHPKDSLIKGKVTKIQANGAVIMLDEGDNITGFIRIAEISVEHIKDINDKLSEDQEVKFKIINIDEKSKDIALSIKAIDKESVATSNKSNYKVEQITPTTLGGLIKEQLNKK